MPGRYTVVFEILDLVRKMSDLVGGGIRVRGFFAIFGHFWSF